MSTQNIFRDDAATLLIDEDEFSDFRQWVVFACSEAVDMNGEPLERVAVDLIEDDPARSLLAQTMVAASEEFPAAEGWIIEYQSADQVTVADMERLIRRYSIDDEWPEFLGAECETCGGSGILSRGLMRFDCPECGSE